jgi:hypothetical protein
MAVIVLHAGMPKTGSSSIQQWLQGSWRALREEGFTVLTTSRSDSDDIAFVPYEQGAVDSGWMIGKAVGKPPAAQQRTVDAVMEELVWCAARFGDLIVSSEHFSLPLWSLHSPTLAGFQQLSSRHELRVAYYVRPQDSALEAAWRQAGFRTEAAPSVYIAENAARMDYAATRRGVRELAPGVDFEPRPFRRDLLDRGDVVRDFARHFLGIELRDEAEWVNRSLPLEVVNLLRVAPAAMFWDESYGNRRIARIKALLDGERFPEDDRIALSRLVLRKYAFEKFGKGNAELGLDDFVLSPDDPERIPGLEALDRLWMPSASPAERSVIFRALRAVI